MNPDQELTKLILIGGAYKSGTSVLCRYVESKGYENPAWLSNPNEHGYGIRVPYYPTRECCKARNFNRLLVDASTRESDLIERSMAGYIRDLVLAIGPRLVIKDPYMKLFAGNWMRAANAAGIVSTQLFTTSRNPHDVRKSLENSRFLRKMQRQYPRVFNVLQSSKVPDVVPAGHHHVIQVFRRQARRNYPGFRSWLHDAWEP